MTVCIAAMAHEYLISVSDTMIHGAVFSSDGRRRKEERLTDAWLVMISGNDITHAPPIIDRATELLKGKSGLHDVRRCVKQSVQERVVEVATDRVLSRFGIDMKTFLKSGKKLFDSATFSSMCADIRAVNLSELQLLVHGFSSEYESHIFTVNDQGEDVIYDRVGFAVIGSGFYAAESLLMFFNQSRGMDLNETVANVCAAKFLAERSGVGRDTSVFVSQYGKQTCRYRAGFVEELRTEWEKTGAPRISPASVEIVNRADIKCLRADEILEDIQYLGSTIGDSSPQPPLPESPGGSDAP